MGWVGMGGTIFRGLGGILLRDFGGCRGGGIVTFDILDR